jgi:undecaprenyl phosphate-alpha-L-ara4N flippase subunit ArnE
MSPFSIAICVLCQLLLVIGQLFLKKQKYAIGVVFLAAWFFFWLGLLARWDLSRIFPFEGLNPALVVLGAMIFLKERMPIVGWIGVALISVGVTLVSMS